MSIFELILTAIGSGISGGVLTQFLKLKKEKADFYKDEIEYLTQRLAKYKEENEYQYSKTKKETYTKATRRTEKVCYKH